MLSPLKVPSQHTVELNRKCPLHRTTAGSCDLCQWNMSKYCIEEYLVLSIEEMRREGSRFERLELFTLRNAGQIAARQVELIKSCRPFSLRRRLFFIYLVFESTAYIPSLKYDCYHLLVVNSYTPDVQLFTIRFISVRGFLVEISVKAFNVHFDSL